MKLDPKLLTNSSLDEMFYNIRSDEAVRGLYNHIFYILRLHPDVHKILRKVEANDATDYSQNEISLAASTLFHENIHWWQYVGSTSGLIMSLNLPAQVMTSLSSFKEYLKLTGKKKPIITYSENNINPSNMYSDEFKAVSEIVNNFHDFDYFKRRVKKPSSIKDVCNERYFTSIGNIFHIAYSASLGLLESTFDPKCSFIPNANEWFESFRQLEEDKVDGFHDESVPLLPPLGAIDLYEGQACFNQMLFLHIRSDRTLDFNEFVNAGMLHGVYNSAFEGFLKVLGEERPASVESPLVALYLLLIDIAINPGEGFPFNIVNYESFVDDTCPGTRFIFLCRVVKDCYPEFKTLITKYSPEEYYFISNALCDALNLYSPGEYLSKFVDWCENENSLKKLLKENESFSYDERNHLVRLIFGRFLSFQLDKIKNPEFFCWPGAYLEGERRTSNTDRLYKKHQAIFKENINMDIGPSTLPDIESEVLEDTAGHFYSALTVYELCRQWALSKGDFNYNLPWISKEHSKKDADAWIKNNFINVFGVSPDDFEIINPKADL